MSFLIDSSGKSVNLTSFKKCLSILRKKYPNDGSYSVNIVKVINKLKPKEHTNKTVKKALEKYRYELVLTKRQMTIDLEKQIPSQKEIDNFITLNEMKEIFNKMNDSIDKLMIGFYLFYPSLRSDWSNVKISEDNYFVFDKFVKTTEYSVNGNLKKPIVNELKPLIKFLPEVPNNSNSFCKKLMRITKRNFGKSIGINQFRKIWVYENSDLSTFDRKLLAKEMNHTIGISRLHYEKKNLN